MHPNSVRAALFAGVAAIAVAAAMAPAGTARAEAPISSARQPLETALTRLGQVSERNILFSPALVRGKTGAPVSDAGSAEAALTAMLAGTGLTFEVSGDGSITIVRAAPAPGPRADNGGDNGAGATDTAAATEVEGVLVTGSREVITPVGDIKREQGAVVDSITATQLLALPDTSLAEALDRVVGVSSDRGYNSSQPRTVTVRGFDARYNSMDIDGNPIWNASRNNRGTQLDVFPASVVSQINVYKTVRPEQDANSIGGHVELRSLRAFDGGSRPYLAMRAEVGHYDQDGERDGNPLSYHVSGVAKRTFGPDNRYGIVVGADLQRERFSDTFNAATAYAQNAAGTDVVNGSLFGGAFDKRVARMALYGKLEAHVTDQLYAFLAVDYFAQKNTEHDYRTGPFITATNVTGATPRTGAFTKATGEAYLEDYSLDRKTTVVGAGVDYRTDDRSVLGLRASYTRYDHDEVDSVGERFQLGSLSGTYDITGTGSRVVFNANPAITNPASWLYRNTKAAFDKKMPNIDNVYSLRAEYGFNTFRGAQGLGFSTGVDWRRLDRDFDQTTDNYLLPKNPVLKLSDVIAPGTLVDGFNPVMIDSGRYWALVHSTGIKTVDTSLTADYHLVEDVYGAHAELTYATDKLRAMAGFRYEATSADDTTGDVQGGLNVVAERSIDYSNLMPNVQAEYDLTGNLRLRAAYTETLARPDFVDFAMGQTVTQDANGHPVVKGTNPHLEPRTSQNLDASLEYYFHGGYASLGVFSKDLDHETFTQLKQTLDGTGVVVLTETTPLNTGSGQVRGFEASFVKERFDELPGALAGLGVSANYTNLDGEWRVVFTDGTRRSVGGLRNQPRWLANLQLSYTAGPAKIDLAWRLRGRTFTGTFGTTAPGDVWVDDYTRLDLQANWTVRKGFAVYGAVRNLTDAYWVEDTGLGQALSVATGPGRSFWIGFKYRPKL